MTRRPFARRPLRPLALVAAALAAVTAAPRAAAQEVRALDPHARATVTASPPRVRIEWNAMPNTASFEVSRRDGPGDPWRVLAASLPGTATRFEDADVVPGRAYEYSVERAPAPGTNVIPGAAYLYAGIDVPFADDPGAVLLVVDRTAAAALAMELARLADDLARDGWTVAREDVDPTSTPPRVRERIQAAARAHAGRLRAVFLLGSIPRPLSGLMNPDGHPDHRGAWPADGYYGDVDGTWTDSQNLGGVGPFVNTAGDGRFDQSVYPSDLDVAVGRVDMRDLPAFTGMDSIALLRRYLGRDHDYRTGALRVRGRGWVTDEFGYHSGGAYARVAWRDGTAIYGAEPEAGPNLLGALEDPTGGYAFALACGGGSPTSVGSSANTQMFTQRMPRAVFLGLFGSYFGDWNYSNNLMRAALASPGAVLTTIWFARPWAHLHALGAMRSFGEAFLAGANNSADYDTGVARRSTHQALLGDPTLRLFVTRPPSALRAEASPDGVTLRWRASEDTVAGYHVYRRAADAASATRLTERPVAATEFTDRTAMTGARYTYRVVAAQLVTTGGGTFYNHSLGEITEATGVAPAPDAGGVDAAAVPDGGLARADAGLDGGMARAPGGCGCAVPGGDAAPAEEGGVALGAAVALALGRRRRRAR